MTHAIWNDILLRIKNLRGDMIGQWQGDIDNRAIEQSTLILGTLIRSWEMAEPKEAPPLGQP